MTILPSGDDDMSIESDDHARFQLAFDPDTGRIKGKDRRWRDFSTTRYRRR